MSNKLNIFLSDNEYLNTFFTSKEKSSKTLTIDDIINLNIVNTENKIHFSFFGIEKYKVWREVFVPLSQTLLSKNDKFTISANLYEQAPNSFQIHFCKENNITLFYNISKLSSLKDLINSLSDENLSNVHIKFFVTDNNISDIDTIFTEYNNKQNLNISFNNVDSLNKKNKKSLLNKFEDIKKKILNKEIFLIPNNFAYYTALDIVSMENIDFTNLTDFNKNLFISNNLNIYKDSNLKDACSPSLLLGIVENNEIRFKIMTKFAKEELTISCNTNDIFDYINSVNSSKNKEDLIKMSEISNELFSILKFSKDENLIKCFEKIKKDIKSMIDTLRTFPESIPYDSII